MTVTRDAHPEWTPDAWAHLEQRRAQRQAAGIVFPNRRWRRIWRRPAPPPTPTLHVEVGKHVAWLIGENVRELLDTAGVTQRRWDAERLLWVVPVDHAGDVITVAEWRERRIVTVVDVDR